MPIPPREIFFIFASACVAAFVIGGVVSVMRRARAGLPFRRPVAPGARYADTWISARSLRTRLNRFGGAKNCVWATVTADELWTGLHFPFNVLLPVAGGLERRVRGEDIVAVEDAALLPVRTRVVVRFRRSDGAVDSTELAVRDGAAFRQALAEIGAPPLLTPDGPSPRAPSGRGGPTPVPSARPTPSRS